MGKYLVTGGAGFIGSHIVERLLKDGHFVRVLDNFSSGKEKNLFFVNELQFTNYELLRGDIRDKETCLKATAGIDFVSHQAALRSVPKSLENPQEYNEVNINGTLNMLEAALENKVKCFILASSSSIYGEAKRFPQKEIDAPLLISPYALTKLAGEHYCRIFNKIYGLNTVSLRYFNVFGPRQALDDEYAVVIPKFIDCILNNQQPPVHGTGRQSRDFTYVDNVVEANLLAVKKDDLKGEVVNIASGKDYSILDLVEIINEITAKKIKSKFTLARKGDVARTLADLSKARRVLDYRPYINFREGLEKTIVWFKNKG